MPNDLWYFAYGSNLDLARKQGRTGAIREAHLATLSGYRLAFNKKGSHGEVYANLMADPTEETIGVIYRCSSETLDALDRLRCTTRGHYCRDQAEWGVFCVHQKGYDSTSKSTVPPTPPGLGLAQARLFGCSL